MAGSALVRALAAVVRTFVRPVDSRTAPPVTAAARLVDDSRLFGAVDRMFVLAGGAWSRAVRGARALIMSASAPRRVTMIGWAVLGAVGSHTAMVGPDNLVGPFGSGLAWIALVPLALLCILRPDAVAAAWRSRRG